MKKIDIIVTSYANPDLDGTACAIAYAEFLKKNGQEAIGAVFGTLHRETEFVLHTGNILPPLQAEKLFTKDIKIILVDASDTDGIANVIDPLQVIEVIDHRKVHQAEKFTNANIQIELVGSAATLIAEKFYKSKIPISPSSALLLYGAIISNTINFQATVTTLRDRKMARWLKRHCFISEQFVHDMFVSKSLFTEPLLTVFEHDFARIPIGETIIGIVQLEIVDTKNFIAANKQEIQRLLLKMKKDRGLSRIFLTIIDIEKAINTFITIDIQTEQLLEKTLHLHFDQGIAEKSRILMRKQIVPLLKEVLDLS